MGEALIMAGAIMFGLWAFIVLMIAITGPHSHFEIEQNERDRQPAQEGEGR